VLAKLFLPLIMAHENCSTAAFGKKAGSYEKHAFVQAHAAKWLAQWMPSQQHDLHCLEFGAGTGLLTRHLIGLYEHLESSDIEPAMVKVCQENYPSASHSVRDAWVEQTADIGQWDLIVASSVLQWAREPVHVMANWRNLLTRNGRIIAGFYIQPTLPEMLAVTGGATPLIWKDADGWLEVFKDAHLELVRMQSDTRRYHYPSALEFWKSIHGTGAAVSRKISPSQMMRFFRDYELQFRDAKGVYATWTFCRVELKASSSCRFRKA
jgi:malonyl-CoA O-methyltransferase